MAILYLTDIIWRVLGMEKYYNYRETDRQIFYSLVHSFIFLQNVEKKENKCNDKTFDRLLSLQICCPTCWWETQKQKEKEKKKLLVENEGETKCKLLKKEWQVKKIVFFVLLNCLYFFLYDLVSLLIFW